MIMRSEFTAFSGRDYSVYGSLRLTFDACTVDLVARLLWRTLFEETQVRFLNPKFCEATIQTDQRLHALTL